MGSVLVNHPRSDCMDTSYTMLGGAITSSESVYRTSSHPASQHPSSHLETGSSRSASSNSTPTSSTAPPSTSAAGSGRLPSHPTHDVPAYINRPSHSHPSSQPSTRASSATPGSAHTHPPSASMTSTTNHLSRPDSASHPAAHPSHHAGGANHATAAAPTSAPHTGSQSSPASPQLRPTFQSLRSLGGSEASSPSRIKVRDLSHIQSFASEEFLAQRDRTPGQWNQERQYEISSMPVTDIIEMVAGLLMKITSTNDLHHESAHRHIPPPDGSTTLSPQATSVLAFHGKNVPSISILSYLTRIHKYCPTTYEVFLSLLVYFDRMTELVNKGQLDRLRRRCDHVQDGSRPASLERSSTHPTQASPMVTPPSSAGIAAQDPSTPSSISPSLQPQEEEDQFSHFFIVDSFNIHRLVIAGVTCASKFFSDVFYTNSRYAKVGGLPLVELNHLELQFLLLNDFRLSIAVEELEAYGTMLVEFYAREVVAQQQQQLSQPAIPRSIDPTDNQSEGMYMRTRDKPRTDQPEIRQTPTPP
ncbi:cyclin-domain-containing protein [Aspergillus sclerotioniger CBS 115572]|uniref:Cyclin-domain-containing protein n=1 Tax=Aspergillus sclerotioniger CBS 115572 TaxID=1450535 RepID=A0A317VW49_9EURO|nr:cyclin-domain-containing protein [Aspergillus sclerotioniger CBS 115572]PWY77247.1 cyclin-domain-containing protein [Aspergillus sclerotioniger CBS 115572]